MLAPDITRDVISAEADLRTAIAMALAGDHDRVKQLIGSAHQTLTALCADDFQKTTDQRNALIFLVTQTEMAVETGRLAEYQEIRLRHHIARVCKTFGIPSIAEREEENKGVAEHDDQAFVAQNMGAPA